MSFAAAKRELLTPQKEQYLRTFLLALLTAAFLFVPFMIKDYGYFLFYGDFNVQQITFYQYAHDSILEGSTAWSFGTDLGTNFVGSYSFYNLGSPFFLITLLFPSEVVPYLMGPLLILKFALAALTAYSFIRRFTRTPDAACIGGLLYAFSGFSVYNIFFNHFHEAIIIFPLLLLSMELLITENRRGFFAIVVAVSAIMNYFFFFGMVVFAIIYWFVRVLSGNYKMTFARFGALLFEAVLGLLMSAIMLLPAALAVLQNSRVTEFNVGWGGIMYGREQIYGNIFQCFFFPPDIPARPVFFPDANVKWSSLGGWLPLFSMVGVFAVMQQKKGSWQRRLLGICIFMAMVPVLNSAFYMFNFAYYARWFYMPILIMCLSTSMAIEDTSIEWKTPFRWVFGITLAIALVIGLFPRKMEDGKIVSFGLYTEDENNVYLMRFIITCAIAIAALIVLRVLLPLIKKNQKSFMNLATVFVMVFSMVYGIVFIATGKSHSFDEKSVMIDQLIECDLTLPDSDNYRIDVYDGVDNTGMFLDMPTINAFHSIVPKSVTDFWEYVGEERGVASRPTESSYAARSLLSVKYLLDREGRSANDSGFTDNSGEPKMPGFTYEETRDGYKIYRNQNYIPYGFTYDYYVTRKQADTFAETDRSNLMVKAILLDDAQAIKYSGILKNLRYKNADDEMGASGTDVVYPQDESAVQSGVTDQQTSSGASAGTGSGQSSSAGSGQSNGGNVDTSAENQALAAPMANSSTYDAQTSGAQTSGGVSSESSGVSSESSSYSSEQSVYDFDNVISDDFDEFYADSILDVDISPSSLAIDAAERAATAGTFSRQKDGFTSVINLDRQNLVFFSIPYDEGWSATVNGEPVEIEKVNVGFMAVLADVGENTIVFTYKTPGLTEGMIITGVCVVVLVAYLIIVHFYLKNRKVPARYPEGDKLLERWKKEEEQLEQQEQPTDGPDWDNVRENMAGPPEPSEPPDIGFSRGFWINVNVAEEDEQPPSPPDQNGNGLPGDKDNGQTKDDGQAAPSDPAANPQEDKENSNGENNSDGGDDQDNQKDNEGQNG